MICRICICIPTCMVNTIKQLMAFKKTHLSLANFTLIYILSCSSIKDCYFDKLLLMFASLYAWNLNNVCFKPILHESTVCLLVMLYKSCLLQKSSSTCTANLVFYCTRSTYSKTIQVIGISPQLFSLDWLNTFRIYFRTNSSLVHWSVRRQV